MSAECGLVSRLLRAIKEGHGVAARALIAQADHDEQNRSNHTYQALRSFIVDVMEAPQESVRCCSGVKREMYLVRATLLRCLTAIAKIIPVACKTCKDRGLQVAVEGNLIGVVQDLLEAGADPNSEVMATTLEHTLFVGTTELIELLIRYGIDIHRPRQPEHNEPLLFTVIEDRFGDGESSVGKQLIRLLVENGADPNGADDRGTCLLDVAFRDGVHQAIPTLLELGANLANVSDQTTGERPWSAASTQLFVDCVLERERQRLVEICIALRALDLPSLLVLAIYDADRTFRHHVPRYVAWQIISKVKLA